ncbi:MAG: helix-turn-helix transcriptional regulator [Firmicutes bacterium]|nr:helix-turn-helix transcriptional regulator [Bacillota bacterium]
MSEEILRIEGTPLSVSTYSVESKPTSMNAAGTLEIIFCLQGSVRFSYAYEEFTLQPGEFVSVDKDAYYLYEGTPDNRCVSFFIDLSQYETRHPAIRSMLFICEGTSDGTTNYPRTYYNALKGLLISALKEITGDCDPAVLRRITDQIVDLFANHFNIYFYHYGSQDIDPVTLQRLNEINRYLYEHISEKIMLAQVSRELDLSPGYVSELVRRYSIGFRKTLGYLRANASEKYLLETDLTIMEISERCGFSDPKYYYEAFRTWYLCTPKQFRQRYCRDMPRQIRFLPVGEIRDLLDDLLMAHYREIFLSGIVI